MAFSFFRRHKRLFYILMFVGVLGFVGWGTWDMLAKQLTVWFGTTGAQQVVGRIEGEPVRAGELFTFHLQVCRAGQAAEQIRLMLEQAAQDRRAAERIRRLTSGMSAWPLMAQDLRRGEMDIPVVLGWYALYQEAVRAGFDVPAAQVDGRLEELTQAGLTPKLRREIVRDFAGRNRVWFHEALRVDMTVWGYVNWLAEALVTPVDPQMRDRFVKTQEEMKVRLAVLEAGQFLDKVPSPAEDEISKQFEAYKRYAAGQGPDGCGYRIPDKVAIEYLVADPEAFEEDAKAAVSDETIAAYYEAHKDPEFLVKEEPAEEKPAPKPEEKKAKTSAAGAEKEAETSAAGAEKRARKAASKTEKAAEKAAEKEAETSAAGAEKDQVKQKENEKKEEAPAPEKPAAEEKTEPDAPKAEPEKAPEKKFRPLAEVRDEIARTLLRDEAKRLAQQHLSENAAEVRAIAEPPDLRAWADGRKVRYAAVEKPMTADEIAALEGVGEASRGGRLLGEVAVSLREAVGQERALVALREISDVFVEPKDGRAYAFRVARLEPSREPASLEEVRERVVADLKRAAAFTRAREEAKKLLEKAADKGLAKAAEELGVKVEETEWFARQQADPFAWFFGQLRMVPPTLPGVGASRLFIDEVFQLEPGGRERTLVTLAPERKAVVAELIERRPPSESRYQEMRPMLASQVEWEATGPILRGALQPDALRKRFAITVEDLGPAREPTSGQAPSEPEEL